jgi:hypothetical protein
MISSSFRSAEMGPVVLSGNFFETSEFILLTVAFPNPAVA